MRVPRKAPRPRAARARSYPEEAIQIEVVARLRRAGVRFFHVPNGSKATARYRAKLHALGLEAGVPDIIIVDPTTTGQTAAALELKAPKGRASDEQKQWQHDLAARGWAVAVTYGLDEAIARLRAWGYLP